MRKSHIRDYATAAFRFYAQVGSSDKYKEAIWNEAIERHNKLETRSGGISKPSEAAIMRAEAELNKKAAEILDLEAVEKAIAQIEIKPNGRYIMEALKIVYMSDPEREPDKGEISERVHTAELNIPASEKTIYRWLSLARRLFAEARGLRL